MIITIANTFLASNATQKVKNICSKTDDLPERYRPTSFSTSCEDLSDFMQSMEYRINRPFEPHARINKLLKFVQTDKDIQDKLHAHLKKRMGIIFKKWQDRFEDIAPKMRLTPSQIEYLMADETPNQISLDVVFEIPDTGFASGSEYITIYTLSKLYIDDPEQHALYELVTR